MVSVLYSASVERFSISRMQDLFLLKSPIAAAAKTKRGGWGLQKKSPPPPKKNQFLHVICHGLLCFLAFRIFFYILCHSRICIFLTTQDLRKLWEVLRKYWESPEKFLRKSWKSHEKVLKQLFKQALEEIFRRCWEIPVIFSFWFHSSFDDTSVLMTFNFWNISALMTFQFWLHFSFGEIVFFWLF